MELVPQFATSNVDVRLFSLKHTSEFSSGTGTGIENKPNLRLRILNFGTRVSSPADGPSLLLLLLLLLLLQQAAVRGMEIAVQLLELGAECRHIQDIETSHPKKWS